MLLPNRRTINIIFLGSAVLLISLSLESLSISNISPSRLKSKGCNSVTVSEKERFASDAAMRKANADKDILGELNDLTNGDVLIDCPDPLKYFPNRVIRSKQTSDESIVGSGRLIPKILHVTMRSRCLPDLLIEFLERWQKAIPSYSIFFHDDEAVNNLIYRDWPEFPNLHETLQCVVKGAMKIDIWRQLVVYKYGGLYSDIDVYPTGFRDDTIEANVSAWSVSDSNGRQSQWLFAMEPRHPLAQLTVWYALERVYQHEDISNPQPLYVTGPQVMFLAYARFAHGQSDFLEDGYHIGMHGKVVRKIKADESLVASAGVHEYLKQYPHPFDPVRNVTGRQRVEILTGVQHWRGKRKKGGGFQKRAEPSVNLNTSVPFVGPCQDYIKKLQNDSSTPLGFIA